MCHSRCQNNKDHIYIIGLNASRLEIVGKEVQSIRDIITALPETEVKTELMKHLQTISLTLNVTE